MCPMDPSEWRVIISWTFVEDQTVSISQWLVYMQWSGKIWMLHHKFDEHNFMASTQLQVFHLGQWLKINWQIEQSPPLFAYLYSLFLTM